MEISQLVGGASTAGSQSSRSDEVSQQDFLSLLTTKLRNQDPLEPVQDSEFLGQLASFSALEESKTQTAAIQQLANAVAANTGLQSLSQAASLIGKEIAYEDENRVSQSARVVGVEFNQNGLQLATSTGKLIPLGLISSISEPAPSSGQTVATDVQA